MGQCLSEGFWRPPGAGEGVAADGHLLGTRNSLSEGRQIDERFGARESSLEQDTMCCCTGHETIRRSTDLHYNLRTRVQPDPDDGGQMAIAEQFRIDPGTEMIPTPPIHLPGFDLDQFAMHHDILIGSSTRCWYLTPLLNLSRTAPLRRTGAGQPSVMGSILWHAPKGLVAANKGDSSP